MKSLVCIGLFLGILSQASFCQAGGKDSISSSESRQNIPGYEINFDAGYYPLRSDFSGGWEPLYSLRLGVGKFFDEGISLHLFVDYYYHKLGFSGGMSGFSPQSAKRHDIALYGIFTLFNFLDAGIGTYYSKSDDVTIVYPANTFPPEPWKFGGVSKFDFFFTLGAKYEIPLGNELYLPVGIYFRDSGYGSSLTPWLLRAGVAKRF